MRLLTNGMKIGNATVVVDIIRKGNPEIRPGTAMKPTKITTHNTGNAGRGANAEMHNRYIHNLASYHPKDTTHVSWHLSVDDKFIYQHIPFDEIAWHCGDGNGVNSGNRNSVGVEICENPETNTKQAEDNAIALTALLLKEFKLKPEDVVPHQHWSGKYCPRVILKRDGSFTPYRNRLAVAFSEPPKKEEVKVAKIEEEYEKNANPGPTLYPEYKLAIEAGITDGTYANKPATKAEVAVMVYRGIYNKK